MLRPYGRRLHGRDRYRWGKWHYHQCKWCFHGMLRREGRGRMCRGWVWRYPLQRSHHLELMEKWRSREWESRCCLFGCYYTDLPQIDPDCLKPERQTQSRDCWSQARVLSVQVKSSLHGSPRPPWDTVKREKIHLIQLLILCKLQTIMLSRLTTLLCMHVEVPGALAESILADGMRIQTDLSRGTGVH